MQETALTVLPHPNEQQPRSKDEDEHTTGTQERRNSQVSMFKNYSIYSNQRYGGNKKFAAGSEIGNKHGRNINAAYYQTIVKRESKMGKGIGYGTGMTMGGGGSEDLREYLEKRYARR